MNRDELERLSKAELIDLVLRLQRPEKTSRTSSRPPSTDRKERRENARPGGAKPGHAGHRRALSATPEEIRDPIPTHCEHCGCAFADGAPAELIGDYDEIEIAPVRPFVRRHRRFAIHCAGCGGATKAPAPPVAQAPPCGPRLHARARHLSQEPAGALLSALAAAVARSVRPDAEPGRAAEHVRAHRAGFRAQA
jgi:transposase